MSSQGFSHFRAVSGRLLLLLLAVLGRRLDGLLGLLLRRGVGLLRLLRRTVWRLRGGIGLRRAVVGGGLAVGDGGRGLAVLARAHGGDDQQHQGDDVAVQKRHDGAGDRPAEHLAELVGLVVVAHADDAGDVTSSDLHEIESDDEWDMVQGVLNTFLDDDRLSGK